MNQALREGHRATVDWGKRDYPAEAVTLTVGGQDFALSASPSSGSIYRGQTASYAVSTASTAGFGGMVSLTVSGLPAYATASWVKQPDHHARQHDVAGPDERLDAPWHVHAAHLRHERGAVTSGNRDPRHPLRTWAGSPRARFAGCPAG